MRPFSALFGECPGWWVEALIQFAIGMETSETRAGDVSSKAEMKFLLLLLKVYRVLVAFMWLQKVFCKPFAAFAINTVLFILPMTFKVAMEEAGNFSLTTLPV